jgi:hypothetical protein
VGVQAFIGAEKRGPSAFGFQRQSAYLVRGIPLDLSFSGDVVTHNGG